MGYITSGRSTCNEDILFTESLQLTVHSCRARVLGNYAELAIRGSIVPTCDLVPPWGAKHAQIAIDARWRPTTPRRNDRANRYQSKAHRFVAVVLNVISPA
jgi:hypothetical protein